MTDKVIMYLALAMSIVALIVCGIMAFALPQVVKSVFKIVDEVHETSQELADSRKTDAVTDLKTIRNEKKRFRLFRRKQKLNIN